ncbi:TcaA 3rd/4th domain-containing protein [Enterococcus avium]|uniref:TcaA 3rd/4th domain-containing protein n=1 Tax=Enterococcus avium TaxID=33945 RepID=UPI003DA35D47
MWNGGKDGDYIKILPIVISYQVAGKTDDVQSVSSQRLIRYQNPDFETDSHVTVSLHKISFKVTSNRDGANVLVNDQAVATIRNGQAEIKDMVWHQGLTIQLSVKDNQNQLKSATYQIAAGKYLAEEYHANRPESEIKLDF